MHIRVCLLFLRWRFLIMRNLRPRLRHRAAPDLAFPSQVCHGRRSADCGTAGSHRLALVHPDGAYTYSDLAERVFSVCAALDQRGIPRKDLVAIRASNRWQTVVLLLALIERGTPFVPIHPRYTRS